MVKFNYLFYKWNMQIFLIWSKVNFLTFERNTTKKKKNRSTNEWWLLSFPTQIVNYNDKEKEIKIKILLTARILEPSLYFDILGWFVSAGYFHLTSKKKINISISMINWNKIIISNKYIKVIIINKAERKELDQDLTPRFMAFATHMTTPLRVWDGWSSVLMLNNQ